METVLLFRAMAATETAAAQSAGALGHGNGGRAKRQPPQHRPQHRHRRGQSSDTPSEADAAAAARGSNISHIRVGGRRGRSVDNDDDAVDDAFQRGTPLVANGGVTSPHIGPISAVRDAQLLVGLDADSPPIDDVSDATTTVAAATSGAPSHARNNSSIDAAANRQWLRGDHQRSASATTPMSTPVAAPSTPPSRVSLFRRIFRCRRREGEHPRGIYDEDAGIEDGRGCGSALCSRWLFSRVSTSDHHFGLDDAAPPPSLIEPPVRLAALLRRSITLLIRLCIALLVVVPSLCYAITIGAGAGAFGLRDALLVQTAGENKSI